MSKKKDFIKTPKLIGGNEGFKKLIKENLKYPKEAIKHRIEGIVFIKFAVNYLGEVSDITVEKGIGFGCDEEAVRLVSLLKYEKVKNRGIKLSTTLKVRIKFSLPLPHKQTTINYNYKESKDDQKNGEEYSYNIDIN